MILGSRCLVEPRKVSLPSALASPCALHEPMQPGIGCLLARRRGCSIGNPGAWLGLFQMVAGA